MTHRVELKKLLAGLVAVEPAIECLISGVTDDTRQLQPGDLFIARSGSQDDGARYTSEAVEQGAAALLVEHVGAIPRGITIPALIVPDLRQHLAEIGSRFFGAPADRLKLIGVTGTNGKTSCTTLIAQLLQQTALIGTRGYRYQGAMKSGGQTTPGSLRLQEIFTELLAQGANNVAMEVSSHALDQGRVAGLGFDTVVFTGLGHDHLDYHGDLQSYAEAKKKLFVRRARAAVINTADDLGIELAQQLDGNCELLTYGAPGADLTAELVGGDLQGMTFEICIHNQKFTVRTALIGDFNLDNLLATAGVLLLHGLTVSEVVTLLGDARPVPGRMERMDGSGPLVVVDYAHNPEGLLAALTALRAPTGFTEQANPALKPEPNPEPNPESKQGRLWCLFGCGGERDQAKRARMGEIASGTADVVVLTDDNPRHESPLQIVDQVVAGCTGSAELHRIHDRRQAITFVLQQAADQDRVLIAGKGDEPDQLFAGGRWRFDDRRIAQLAKGWRR